MNHSTPINQNLISSINLLLYPIILIKIHIFTTLFYHIHSLPTYLLFTSFYANSNIYLKTFYILFSFEVFFLLLIIIILLTLMKTCYYYER